MAISSSSRGGSAGWQSTGRSIRGRQCGSAQSSRAGAVTGSPNAQSAGSPSRCTQDRTSRAATETWVTRPAISARYARRDGVRGAADQHVEVDVAVRGGRPSGVTAAQEDADDRPFGACRSRAAQSSRNPLCGNGA